METQYSTFKIKNTSEYINDRACDKNHCMKREKENRCKSLTDTHSGKKKIFSLFRVLFFILYLFLSFFSYCWCIISLLNLLLIRFVSIGN